MDDPMGWAADALCHDPTNGLWAALWDVSPGRSRVTRQERAQALCAGCPVLSECRDYAAGFAWAGVVIAGWAAPPPSRQPEYPPWADVTAMSRTPQTRAG